MQLAICDKGMEIIPFNVINLNLNKHIYTGYWIEHHRILDIFFPFLELPK